MRSNNINSNVSFTSYGYSKIRHNARSVFNQICKTLESQNKVSFEELTDIVQKKTGNEMLLVHPFDMLKEIYPQLFKGDVEIRATSIPGHFNDGYPKIFAGELTKESPKDIVIFVHEFTHIVQSLKRKDKASQKALNLGIFYTKFEDKFFLEKDKNATIEEYTHTFTKKWLNNCVLEKNKKNAYIKFLMERATKEKEAYRIESEIHKKLKATQLAKDYMKLSNAFKIIVLELKKYLTANGPT